MTAEPRPRSVRALPVLVLVACLLSAGGCYNYHVYRVGGPEGRELGNQPSTEWQAETLHSFLWGTIRQDLPVENCPTVAGYRTGIEEVEVETNLGYVVLSALTLGTWVPVRVRWRCARPPSPTGTLGEESP